MSTPASTEVLQPADVKGLWLTRARMAKFHVIAHARHEGPDLVGTAACGVLLSTISEPVARDDLDPYDLCFACLRSEAARGR